MNTEFWVAVGEGVAIVLGIVEEVIRNMLLKKKRKKENTQEGGEVEVTLTEKDVEKDGAQGGERALKISVVKKGNKECIK